MKKKALIVIAIVLGILVALGIMYMIDMYMMKNNKHVIFSTWGYDYAPPEIIGNVVNIIDKTNENNYACSMALEKIFEDNKNEYYLNCIKSEYIIVKYENGYQENVKEALKNGNIEIQDLDRFNIGYITQIKQEQCKASFVGTILEIGTTYIMVAPNENEVERKSSDKIVVNYPQEAKNNLYKIRNKVVVCYSGDIMETYPARIDAQYIGILD